MFRGVAPILPARGSSRLLRGACSPGARSVGCREHRADVRTSRSPRARHGDVRPQRLRDPEPPGTGGSRPRPRSSTRSSAIATAAELKQGPIVGRSVGGGTLDEALVAPLAVEGALTSSAWRSQARMRPHLTVNSKTAAARTQHQRDRAIRPHRACRRDRVGCDRTSRVHPVRGKGSARLVVSRRAIHDLFPPARRTPESRKVVA